MGMNPTKFEAGWWTSDRVKAVLDAKVFGVDGSQERIMLIEYLRSLAIEGNFIKPITQELVVPTEWLAGWARGAIAGWSTEMIPVNGVPVPMTDGDRNLIRLSCKATKTWEYVVPRLPALKEDPEFATDSFTDADIVDLEESIKGGNE